MRISDWSSDVCSSDLLAGVEMGVIAGVSVGLLLYLWRASRPHAAIVGRVPETEHFRNVDRHQVFTVPHVLSIRIDESLTYLNARWLAEYVLEEIADRPEVRPVILMCSAVNEIRPEENTSELQSPMRISYGAVFL